jgi:hypothetical protein
MPREISCRVEILDYRNDSTEAADRTILLSVDGDSRHETWETLVEKGEWGVFEDIEGFDPNDPEIVGAVDCAVAELRGMREEDAT